MATIRDILFDIAPEFETADTDALARVDRFINRAAGEVNRAAWGCKADEATALLAAHRLTMRARPGNAAGAVTMERTADRQRNFAVPASGAGDILASTSYGAEFVRLRKTIVIGPQVL